MAHRLQHLSLGRVGRVVAERKALCAREQAEAGLREPGAAPVAVPLLAVAVPWAVAVAVAVWRCAREWRRVVLSRPVGRSSSG